MVVVENWKLMRYACCSETSLVQKMSQTSWLDRFWQFLLKLVSLCGANEQHTLKNSSQIHVHLSVLLPRNCLRYLLLTSKLSEIVGHAFRNAQWLVSGGYRCGTWNRCHCVWEVCLSNYPRSLISTVQPVSQSVERGGWKTSAIKKRANEWWREICDVCCGRRQTLKWEICKKWI